MKKKLLTLAMAAVMVVSSAVTAFAADPELVTENTTFTGAAADGSEGWNSAGTGKVFPVTEDGVTIVFHNDAFTDSKDHGNGDKFGDAYDNWDNFVLETIATDAAKGVTMRADNFSWTYGDSAVAPTVTSEISWVWEEIDWKAMTDDTDVTLVAKKADANTVTFTITFASDATAKEVYTLTYADGVPADLQFQVGADGGKMELKSATFGSTEKDTQAPTETTTVAAGGNNNSNNSTGSTGSGDTAPVLALLAVAAVAGAVVVLRKKEVTE